MNTFKAYLREQQFNPRVAGIFTNPFYLTRRALWKHIASLAPQIQGRTLDIGCGHKPYKTLFGKITEYVGIEYDTPGNRNKKQADVFYDGKSFPFPDATFDAAIATQVIEHVFNPDDFLHEASRVLKRGGKILITVPFVWDEHEQPFDYARYSSFGLRHILEKHGLEVIEQKKSVNDIRVVFQLINCYIHKKLEWIKIYKVKLIFYILLISPFTICGILLSKITPKNNDLYLDNIVIAQKK